MAVALAVWLSVGWHGLVPGALQGPSSAPGPIRMQNLAFGSPWEVAYRRAVSKHGAKWAALSWKGFSQLGRGAIVVNEDADSSDVAGMYVPLNRIVPEAAPPSTGDGGREAIIQRVESYHPSKEFVVVYQHGGVMGADIVKPNISPKIMASRAEQGSGDGDSEPGTVIDV